MIKLFRNIRRRLLTENPASSGVGKTVKPALQSGRYLKYAIGEIILVVIGILIALQVNNLNETKRKDFLFKDSMEQIFNGLKSDVDVFNSLIKDLNGQVGLIDLVLNSPEKFDMFETPFALHYIWWDRVRISTETKYFTQNLIYNPEDKKQKSMAKNFANYVMTIDDFNSNITIDFNEILNNHGLPRPYLPSYIGPEDLVQDSTFFTESQMNIAAELIRSEDIRSILKTIKTKTIYDIGNIMNFTRESESLISRIKLLYPEVKVLYENVGIIGTAINGWGDFGAISTPLLDADDAIFVTEMFLKEGLVKFRCNDSWLKNWGGDTFPEGEAISDGNNILVDQAGMYHISLDLDENKYYFTRLGD
jgi:hypothetical protein